jgi:hypothetical protein
MEKKALSGLVRWLFAALSVWLVACQPAVTLRSATLRGATPTGVAFDAVMAVENPNLFDIEVRAIRANAKLEGVRGVVPVYVEPHTWIPAGRTVLIPVPIILPWQMIAPVIAATVGNSKVTYYVSGTADVTATRAFAIDRDEYEFDEEGELPRGFLMKVGVGGFQIGIGQ